LILDGYGFDAMKMRAATCFACLGLLAACTAMPEHNRESSTAAAGYGAPYDSGDYRFVSFSGITTEEGYWHQDLGRIGLAGPVGELKECLIEEVVGGSSPALRAAVRRFLADKTEANYRAFPLKGQWFIRSGKISIEQFANLAYAHCAALHPPMQQKASFDEIRQPPA
jgi:hypothetical protein